VLHDQDRHAGTTGRSAGSPVTAVQSAFSFGTSTARTRSIASAALATCVGFVT
jgi:hypothetical protein